MIEMYICESVAVTAVRCLSTALARLPFTDSTSFGAIGIGNREDAHARSATSHDLSRIDPKSYPRPPREYSYCIAICAVSPVNRQSRQAEQTEAERSRPSRRADEQTEQISRQSTHRGT